MNWNRDMVLAPEIRDLIDRMVELETSALGEDRMHAQFEAATAMANEMKETCQKYLREHNLGPGSVMVGIGFLLANLASRAEMADAQAKAILSAIGVEVDDVNRTVKIKRPNPFRIVN